MYPDDLKYTDSHEWVRLEGKVATFGLTHHAQSELGDVVYVELPAVGKDIKTGGEFGVIESVKAASDVYAPVSGKVTAVNEKLAQDPALVNRDCYGEGWLVKVEVADAADVAKLKNAGQYKELIGA